ncbi:MAG: DMT family transporter [Clostridia bacterium]|nr:DMT family transporter [Clostridia bacterium]
MPKIKRNRLLFGCLCALGCEILYGLSYVFTKQAAETAGALPLLGWRFIIAAVVMGLGVCFGLFRVRLKGKALKPLLPIVLLSPCAYFIGETVGIDLTTASESGVFLACIPVVSLIASSLILRKKPTGIQIAGILITLFGVLLTVLALGASASLSVAGYLFLLIAVLSYVIFCVLVEKAEAYTETEITFVMLVAGAIFFGLAAAGDAVRTGTLGEVLRLPFSDASFAAAVLYQGIGCSIFAFLLDNTAITTIGVNRTASFIGVSTVVSVVAGAVYLHEPFGVPQIIGAVVIIAGVYIANADASHTKKQQEE